MSQKRHSPEQIINKLRRAEVELAKGATVTQDKAKIKSLMSKESVRPMDELEEATGGWLGPATP